MSSMGGEAGPTDNRDNRAVPAEPGGIGRRQSAMTRVRWVSRSVAILATGAAATLGLVLAKQTPGPGAVNATALGAPTSGSAVPARCHVWPAASPAAGRVGSSVGERAAMEPNHDRPLRALLRPGRPDVQRKAVFGFRRGVRRAGKVRQFGPRGRAQTGLRRVPRVLQRIAHARPGRRPAWRHEAVGARCRRPVGDALEGGHVLDDAPRTRPDMVSTTGVFWRAAEAPPAARSFIVSLPMRCIQHAAMSCRAQSRLGVATFR